MNQITEAIRDSKRLRLIATALELMQYERTDSAAIPIPGTDPQRYVIIGTAATAAQLLEIAPAAAAGQPAAPSMPPLPLDLDNSPARMSMHVKAGELAEIIRRWGREVYAAAQAAKAKTGSENASVLTIPTAIMHIAVDSCQSDEYLRGHRDARHAAADLVLERADELVALVRAPLPAQDAGGGE